MINVTPRFKLGRLMMSKGVNDKAVDDSAFTSFVLDSLNRHAVCDWGDLCDEDRNENDLSLENGLRILSAYVNGETKIWIITEADRSATTILFPLEY